MSRSCLVYQSEWWHCSSAGEGDDRDRSIIDPCSVLSPEVIDDGQILGSWADRKVAPLLISVSGSVCPAEEAD